MDVNSCFKKDKLLNLSEVHSCLCTRLWLVGFSNTVLSHHDNIPKSVSSSMQQHHLVDKVLHHFNFRATIIVTTFLTA